MYAFACNYLWILSYFLHPRVMLLRVYIMSSRTRCMLVSSFVMGSRKIHITFLNCIWGTAPPNAQVRRDNFPDPRVRKCIHIMHRLSISSWHHNEHIVPAFVHYHIPASHFAWVIASSCICIQHTFSSTNYIPFIFMFAHPCVFLYKNKKGEAWNFTLHS